MFPSTFSHSCLQAQWEPWWLNGERFQQHPLGHLYPPLVALVASRSPVVALVASRSPLVALVHTPCIECIDCAHMHMEYATYVANVGFGSPICE